MMFQQNQILEKIHDIQQGGMTGLLKLTKNSKEIVFYFCDGLIDGAGSDIEQLQLGRMLVKSMNLQASALPKILEQARRKRRIFGEAAVLQKYVDDPELRDGVREQIILTAMFALTHEFQIDSFQDSPVNLYMPAKFSFDGLMLELARKNLKPFHIDPKQLIGLNNGHSLSHFPWYPQEVSVLGRLKTPCTMKDLAASTGLELASLDKILAVFDAMNLINRVDDAPGESTALVKREDFPLQYLIPAIGDSALSDKIETYHNATSFISEQFKNLKVRINEASSAAPLQVIAISSPQPEDGKSLICANLAVSFSKDPKRHVVVIDCDLRNPSLHKYLGTSVEPGALGYIENDNLQPYCFMRRLGPLYLMTAGGTSVNPVEHLSGPRMRDLIHYLRSEFDTIILDCPPFGPISDAQVLTTLADGMLMVVRRGKTSYGALEKACRHLDRNKLIGMIFNDVKPMMFNTQYDYRYYHYRSSYPYRAVKTTRRPRTYLE
jgi:capsular exopolysaccharide synthesis family protein